MAPFQNCVRSAERKISQQNQNMPNLHNRYKSTERKISQKNPECMLNYSLIDWMQKESDLFTLLLMSLQGRCAEGAIIADIVKYADSDCLDCL
jgi:uncharacterized protein VirK/YbjX